MKRNEIEYLIPSTFRRASSSSPALSGLLDAMEELHTPSERILESLDLYWDPLRTPDRLVPFLAHWVGLGWVVPVIIAASRDAEDPSGLRRLRTLISVSTRLDKMRGTRQGLINFLEIACSQRGFEITQSPDKPFHLVIQGPYATAKQRELIVSILESEKPAYMTFELLQDPIGGEFSPEDEPG